MIPVSHLYILYLIDTVRKCMSHESQCRMQQDCSARRIVSRKYSIQHWIKFCSNFLTNWSLNIPRCDASHSLSSLLPLAEPGGFSEGGGCDRGWGDAPRDPCVPSWPSLTKSKTEGDLPWYVWSCDKYLVKYVASPLDDVWTLYGHKVFMAPSQCLPRCGEFSLCREGTKWCENGKTTLVSGGALSLTFTFTSMLRILPEMFNMGLWG